MTTPLMPWVCMNCKHNSLFKLGLLKLHCEAFPDGIPDEILMGNNDHIEPFDGDNGIQFELGSPESNTVKEGFAKETNVKVINEYQKENAQGRCPKGTVLPDSFACSIKDEIKKEGSVDKVLEKADTAKVMSDERPTVYAGDIEGMAQDIKAYKKDGNVTFHNTGDGIIAKIDGQEAGYISILGKEQTDLSVAQEYQGKGLGKKLALEFFDKYPEMMYKTGGFTEAGKATYTAALRELVKDKAAKNNVTKQQSPDEKSLLKKVKRNNELYKIFDEEIQSGPLDGGCYAMAKALQNVMGGELYSVTGLTDAQENAGMTDKNNAQHVILKVGNTYWDADGKASEKTVLKRWKDVEGVNNAELRPFDENDVPESPRSKELVDRVTKHLSEGTKQNEVYVEPIELKLNYKCPKGMFVPDSFMCGETKSDADKNYKKYKDDKAKGDDRAAIKKDTDLSNISRLAYVPAIRKWSNIIHYLEEKGITALTYREGSEYDYAAQRAKHPDAILINYDQIDGAKTMDIAYKYAKKEMEKDGGIKGFSDIEGLSTAISKKDLKTDTRAFYDATVGYDLKEWGVKKTSEQDIIALAIVDMQNESLGIRNSILKEKAPTLYKYLVKSLKDGKFGELGTVVGFGKEYADTGVRLRDQPIAQDLIFDSAGFKGFEPLEKEGEKVSEFGAGKPNLYVDVDEKNGKLIITKALLGQGSELFDSEETIGKYLAASMLMKSRQGKLEDVVKDTTVVDDIYRNIKSSTMIDSRQKKMWMEYEDRLNDVGRRNAFLVELAYREPKLFKSEFPKTFETIRAAIESNTCGNDVRNILGGALANVKTHNDIIREKKAESEKIESSLSDIDKNIINIIKSDNTIVSSVGYDTSIDALGRCARNADDDKKSDILINQYHVKNSKPGEVAATAVHEYTHALMTNVIGDNPRKPDYLNFVEMSKFFGLHSMDAEFKKKIDAVKSETVKEVTTNDLQGTIDKLTETFINHSEENKRWYDSVVYGSELRGDGTAYVTVNNGLYNNNYTPSQLIDNINSIDVPNYAEKNDINNKMLLIGIAQEVHRKHNAATEAKRIYETELVDTAIQMRGSMVAGRSVDWVSTKKSASSGYDDVVKSKKYGLFDTEIDRNIEKKLYALPFEKRSAYLLYDSIKSNRGKAISVKFLDDKITIFDADVAMKSHLDKTDLTEEEKSDIVKFTHGSWVKSVEKNVPVATSAESSWIEMPSERIATFAEALWYAPEQTEKLAPTATTAFRNMVKSEKYSKAAKDIWKVK